MIARNLKMVIIDDHEENAQTNVARLRKSLSNAEITADVEPMSLEDKTRVIEMIEQIGDDWHLNVETLPSFPMLQDVDIVFIDYQLGALQSHSWLTAEDMAGWIRTFTKIPLIIILNRFFDVDFDLTMSQGAIPTAADFHLNAETLESSGLWKSIPWDPKAPAENFRPWMWPRLSEAVLDVISCRDELLADNDFEKALILEYFDFDDTLADQMTHNALGFLDPNSKTPQTATFADLLKHGRLGIANKLQLELLANLSNPAVKTCAVNVLVSGLRRWLSALVLGPQDVLIDSPHLLQRMPWLIGENVNEKSYWDRAAVPSDDSIFPLAVTKFAYPKENWLSRKTFVMPLLQGDASVLELYEKYDFLPQTEYVFLEDFSVFVSIDQAESFTAAFNSIWSTRYVSKEAVEAGDIRYAPKVRLV